MKERYESYLVLLEKQRDQLYKLIRLAKDDPNAGSEEIDRYLDLLNDVNQLVETVSLILDKLNKRL